MKNKQSLVPAERIESVIILIRGQRVILDADLAKIYQVTTKRLNEQVKRNINRFPSDFMFQLTKKEKDEVVANCDHLKNLKFSHNFPYVFTEHGAIMLASVLNSKVAVKASIQVVRAFVYLRKMIASHADLAKKLQVLENKYDDNFKVVFEAIRQLMAPEKKKRNPIGFKSSKN